MLIGAAAPTDTEPRFVQLELPVHSEVGSSWMEVYWKVRATAKMRPANMRNHFKLNSLPYISEIRGTTPGLAPRQLHLPCSCQRPAFPDGSAARGSISHLRGFPQNPPGTNCQHSANPSGIFSWPKKGVFGRMMRFCLSAYQLIIVYHSFILGRPPKKDSISLARIPLAANLELVAANGLLFAVAYFQNLS